VTRYELDPASSRVVIDASSSVHPIHTEASGVSGWVELGDGARGEVSFPVDRLRSGNPIEDRELRRRILAGRHPAIKGELTELVPTDDDGGYDAEGTITFRGVSRACSGALVIEATDDDGVRITGSSTFDVRDFGMEPPRILLLRVHPEVRVAIELRARPAG
jgi:polyisoprenoid-binding protein YceI